MLTGKRQRLHPSVQSRPRSLSQSSMWDGSCDRGHPGFSEGAEAETASANQWFCLGKLWDFAFGNFDLGVRGWRVHITPTQVHPDSFLGPPSRLGTREEGGLEETEAGSEVCSQDSSHRSAREVSPGLGSPLRPPGAGQSLHLHQMVSRPLDSQPPSPSQLILGSPYLLALLSPQLLSRLRLFLLPYLCPLSPLTFPQVLLSCAPDPPTWQPVLPPPVTWRLSLGPLAS